MTRYYLRPPSPPPLRPPPPPRALILSDHCHLHMLSDSSVPIESMPQSCVNTLYYMLMAKIRSGGVGGGGEGRLEWGKRWWRVGNASEKIEKWPPGKVNPNYPSLDQTFVFTITQLPMTLSPVPSSFSFVTPPRPLAYSSRRCSSPNSLARHCYPLTTINVLHDLPHCTTLPLSAASCDLSSMFNGPTRTPNHSLLVFFFLPHQKNKST